MILVQVWRKMKKGFGFLICKWKFGKGKEAAKGEEIGSNKRVRKLVQNMGKG